MLILIVFVLQKSAKILGNVKKKQGNQVNPYKSLVKITL